MSGVVLSHDINTSSPYFSINYNDISTDASITSGSKNNKIFLSSLTMVLFQKN